MSDPPLTVAVSVLFDAGDVLLIHRERGAYTGLWGLPGGKVKPDEHVSGAARREVREECAVDAAFVAHHGVVSEHLHGDDGLQSHFVLHVCELAPASRDVSGSAEGDVAWFDRERVLDADSAPSDGSEAGDADLPVVPSDRRILDAVVGGDGGYYEGLMDGAGGEPTLERFERR